MAAARADRIAQAERRVIEQARLWADSPQTPWPNPRHVAEDRPLLDAVRALEAADRKGASRV